MIINVTHIEGHIKFLSRLLTIQDHMSQILVLIGTYQEIIAKQNIPGWIAAMADKIHVQLKSQEHCVIVILSAIEPTTQIAAQTILHIVKGYQNWSLKNHQKQSFDLITVSQKVEEPTQLHNFTSIDGDINDHQVLKYQPLVISIVIFNHLAQQQL